MGKRPHRFPLRMQDIGFDMPFFRRAYDGVASLREAGLHRVRLHDRRVSLTSYYAAYEGRRSFNITIHDTEVNDVVRVMVGHPCGIVKLKHTNGKNEDQTFSIEDLREISVRFIER